MEEKLFSYIKSAVSPYHGVQAGMKLLEKAGYKELSLTENWDLRSGGRYQVNLYGTSLAAFEIGDIGLILHPELYDTDECLIRIGTAHTDFPCFKIKRNPDLIKAGYHMLNAEPYGGMLMSTWMDRPLSLAGNIVCKSKTGDPFSPEQILVNSEQPVAIIPNLCIHQNRKANEGVAYQPQVDMIPLVGEEDQDYSFEHYIKILAENEELLDYDLYLYNADEPGYVGIDYEYISSPRLDNEASCICLLDAMALEMSEMSHGLNLMVLFDHEEIGSQTKQGAGSDLIHLILNKILFSIGITNEDERNNKMLRSFMISVDAAHATHPNHPETSDPTNTFSLNAGVIIKKSAAMRYATDPVTSGVIISLCEEHNIPYKVFHNRSGSPGGSTLGPIISAHLPIPTADIGMPMLAMHSSRELIHRSSLASMDSLCKVFFGKYPNLK